MIQKREDNKDLTIFDARVDEKDIAVYTGLDNDIMNDMRMLDELIYNSGKNKSKEKKANSFHKGILGVVVSNHTYDIKYPLKNELLHELLGIYHKDLQQEVEIHLWLEKHLKDLYLNRNAVSFDRYKPEINEKDLINLIKEIAKKYKSEIKGYASYAIPENESFPYRMVMAGMGEIMSYYTGYMTFDKFRAYVRKILNSNKDYYTTHIKSLFRSTDSITKLLEDNYYGMGSLYNYNLSLMEFQTLRYYKLNRFYPTFMSLPEYVYFSDQDEEFEFKFKYAWKLIENHTRYKMYLKIIGGNYDGKIIEGDRFIEFIENFILDAKDREKGEKFKSYILGMQTRYRDFFESYTLTEYGLELLIDFLNYY